MESLVPLVSVVMPCKNAARWVVAAIQSVRGQTFENWELLVVDDASTDGSVGIVESFAEDDRRIRLLRPARPLGGAGARNLAIEQARGRYIAFLDADDWWRRDKLSAQLDFMARTGASFTYTAYEKTNRDGQLDGRIYYPPTAIDYASLLRSCVIGCSTVMFDTAVLGRRFFPPLVRSHDYALWLDIMREGLVARGLAQPLTVYREHGGSLSANKLAKLRMAWRIYRRYERIDPWRSAWFMFCYIVQGVRKRSI